MALGLKRQTAVQETGTACGRSVINDVLGRGTLEAHEVEVVELIADALSVISRSLSDVDVALQTLLEPQPPQPRRRAQLQLVPPTSDPLGSPSMPGQPQA